YEMRFRRPRVVGFGTNQAVIANLFQNVSRPSCYPADGESWCKEVPWQANRSQQYSRIKFDIGVEALIRLLFLQESQRQFLHLTSQDELLRISKVGQVTQFFGTRVFRLVHPVPKAHQALSTCQCTAQPVLG